jgi:glycosyltransferase involved in cell wall biosynthesis
MRFEGDPCRILTDIRMLQNRRWAENTTHLDEVNSLLLKRFKNDLTTSIIMFLKRNEYDVLITARLRSGIILGLLQYFSVKTKKPHILLETMLDEVRNNWHWKLKFKLQRAAFKNIDRIVCSAKGEIHIYSNRFGLPGEKFTFIPFHTNFPSPPPKAKGKGYILAAGKSGRDYKTFLEAVKDLHVKVIVVSDLISMQGLTLSPNVEVFYNIPIERYYEILAGADVVVVPLNEKVCSTGQVVILEAMAQGKPLVVTDCLGSRDYVAHGKNGYLVGVGDAETMKEKIMLLYSDKSIATRIGRHNSKEVFEKYSYDKYIAAIMNECRLIS